MEGERKLNEFGEDEQRQFAKFLTSQRLTKSNSEALRLIKAGAVVGVPIENGTIIRVGKRKFIKVMQ